MKPAPVSAAELTVTGTVPVEAKVNICDVAEFSGTFWKAKLAGLILSVCIYAFSVTAKFMDEPPALAVRVAVCVVATGDTLAVN